MNLVSHRQRTQRRHRQRMRNQRYLNDTRSGQRVDGEAHPVHRDRSQRDAGPGDCFRRADVHHPGSLPVPPRHHRSHSVHVALHQVTTQRLARPEGALQVDGGAGPDPAQPGATQGGGNHLDLEPVSSLRAHGQTGSGDRDALPDHQPAVPGPDPEPATAPLALHRADDSDVGYEAGEHGIRSRTSRVSAPRDRRSTTSQRREASRSPPVSSPLAGRPSRPSQSGL